jgi:D-hydroxyproline dehydrogenase subunit alpha
MLTDPYDTVIVGAGPAGLAAALELGRAGLSVALVDDGADLGGQYFRRRHAAILARYGDYRPAGSRLIAAVRAAGVECFNNTFVWGAEEGTLWTTHGRKGLIASLRGRFTLLATGAYEKSIPFLGWTLPGVCTPGCALHFATHDRVRVGDRVLIAGSGPFLLPVAASLLELGVKVVGFLEFNTPYRPSLTALRMALHPLRLPELARYMSTLWRHGLKIRQGWKVLSVQGSGRVNTATIADVSGRNGGVVEELAVDAVCVGYGFRPSAELARLMGCDCATNPLSGDLVPITDGFGRTSKPSVFVAGEVMGIAGAQAALHRGRLAAYAIMTELGLKPLRRKIVGAKWEAGRADAFARLTAELFPIPSSLYASILDETVVCRCERVTAGEVRRAAQLGWNDVHAAKGFTRAGMGPCQGRECGNTVSALVDSTSGGTRPVGVFPARMPLRPISYPQPRTEEPTVNQPAT